MGSLDIENFNFGRVSCVAGSKSASFTMAVSSDRVVHVTVNASLAGAISFVFASLLRFIVKGSLNSVLLNKLLGVSNTFFAVTVFIVFVFLAICSLGPSLHPLFDAPNFIRSRKFCNIDTFVLLTFVAVVATDKNFGTRSGEEKRRGLDKRG